MLYSPPTKKLRLFVFICVYTNKKFISDRPLCPMHGAQRHGPARLCHGFLMIDLFLKIIFLFFYTFSFLSNVLFSFKFVCLFTFL